VKMEEVDSIILETLREIGCELDDDVKLKNLSPESVYKSIRTLCEIISPDTNVPKILPAQMAQRFSAASQLVDRCKSLGFNGDLGYQTILYSNINELRRVFMWLIESLPKSEDKTDSFQPTRSLTKAKSIENEIARKLGSELRQPWVLGFLQAPSSYNFSPVELETPAAKRGDNEYVEKYQLPIFHQTRNIIPSIIATHDIDLMRKNIPSSESSEISKKLRSSMIRSTQSLNLLTTSSRSTLSSMSNLGVTEKLPETAHQPAHVPKSQIEILTERVESLKEQVNEQEDMYNHLTFNRDEVLKTIESDRVTLEREKKDGKLKMQISMLLDSPEESIEKLHQTLAMARQKRQTLNAKFETHKDPLEQQLEALTGTNSVKLERIKNTRESIRSMRHTMTEIQEDVKVKVQLQRDLIEQLNKVKRTTERSAYTSRIADIIASIKKQNYDINEVLKDTRSLQKAINTIEGQLQRQFTVTEELVWTKVRRSTCILYHLLINYPHRLRSKTNTRKRHTSCSSRCIQSLVN
jgi:hypothetical protein